MPTMIMRDIRAGKANGVVNKANGGNININPANKGKLHEDLGISQSKKIPLKRLEQAEHSDNPTIRKRAQFAENARHFNHK